MGVDALTLRRAVFLDRDGVLNEAVIRNGKPYPPADLDGLVLCADAPASCTRLHEAGFLLVVVTNQPDIARGTAPRELVDAIHSVLKDRLPLDDIRVCPHDDADDCDCRKPRPGMILAAAKELGVSLPDSFLVGDRWRDIEAGQRAGCRSIFIDRGYNERAPAGNFATVRSLAEAADWIFTGARSTSVSERNP